MALALLLHPSTGLDYCSLSLSLSLTVAIGYMSYFPPVWIARQVYAATAGPVFGWLYGLALPARTTTHGARAVFHVATHKAAPNPP